MTVRLQSLMWVFFAYSSLIFFGAMIETLTYSGFLHRHYSIDLKTLFLPFFVLGLYFYLKPIKKNTLRFKKLLSLNNRVLLPATTFLMIFFTALEYIHFPNYVFSTYHIQYSNLFYGFALSLLTTIYFLPKKTWTKLERHILFMAPFVLSAIVVLIRLWPDTPFYRLSREDNLFENLQFFFFAGTSAVALYKTIKAFQVKKWLYIPIFAGAFLFLFFIAGEEISWGQRILHTTLPAYFEANNMQQETTIHNLNGLQQYQYVFYLIFSGFLMTMWASIKLMPKKIKVFFRPITPPWYIASFFLPIFLFYLSVNVFNSSHKEWQEFCELLLAAGLFLTMLDLNSRSIISKK